MDIFDNICIISMHRQWQRNSKDSKLIDGTLWRGLNHDLCTNDLNILYIYKWFEGDLNCTQKNITYIYIYPYRLAV